MNEFRRGPGLGEQFSFKVFDLIIEGLNNVEIPVHHLVQYPVHQGTGAHCGSVLLAESAGGECLPSCLGVVDRIHHHWH